MLWISVAVIAYTLLALAALVDKLVVTEYLSSPRVYMFLASVLGAIIVVAAPFALHWPGCGTSFRSTLRQEHFLARRYSFFMLPLRAAMLRALWRALTV